MHDNWSLWLHSSWSHTLLMEAGWESVCIGQHSSPVVPCSVGVLQGCLLGPLLCAIYTSSVAAVVQSHGMQKQQYADDAQLYIALTPLDPSCELALLNHVWPHYSFVLRERYSLKPR